MRSILHKTHVNLVSNLGCKKAAEAAFFIVLILLKRITYANLYGGFYRRSILAILVRTQHSVVAYNLLSFAW